MPKLAFAGSLAPKAATELTIAAGVVTVTQVKHTLAAQAGVTDDLDTINVDADIPSTYEGIALLTAATGDTITIKHSTGNIELSGLADIVLTAGLWLILVYDGTNWRDLKTALLDNYAGAVAPVVTDDFDDGYAVGSTWIDTVADDAYICLDSTVGAAVWKQTTP